MVKVMVTKIELKINTKKNSFGIQRVIKLLNK